MKKQNKTKNKPKSTSKERWIDVSTWKNIGDKYGYFEFFERHTKKSITEINKPEQWRVGQVLFNFLEFLANNGYGTNQSSRLADTFHIPDDELEKMYNLFLKAHK